MNIFNIHEGLCRKVLQELDVNKEVCQKTNNRCQNNCETDDYSALWREPVVEAVKPVPLSRIGQSENLMSKSDVFFCYFFG